MKYLLFFVIAALACIPMLLGATKKFRPCYKGCHGCGKCMKGFETRTSPGEKEPSALPDGEKK